MFDLATSPQLAAAQMLANDLPLRYAHVAAVAARCKVISSRLELDARELLGAAWLHDIGYAKPAVETGFHPLDGARWAMGAGYSPAIVGLIAYHSASEFEARERGYLDALREIRPPDPRLLAILTFADMTIGPNGCALIFEDRLQEVLSRYEESSVVGRSMLRAQGELRAVIAYVDALLAGQSQ